MRSISRRKNISLPRTRARARRAPSPSLSSPPPLPPPPQDSRREEREERASATGVISASARSPAAKVLPLVDVMRARARFLGTLSSAKRESGRSRLPGEHVKCARRTGGEVVGRPIPLENSPPFLAALSLAFLSGISTRIGSLVSPKKNVGPQSQSRNSVLVIARRHPGRGKRKPAERGGHSLAGERSAQPLLKRSALRLFGYLRS